MAEDGKRCSFPMSGDDIKISPPPPPIDGRNKLKISNQSLPSSAVNPPPAVKIEEDHDTTTARGNLSIETDTQLSTTPPPLPYHPPDICTRCGYLTKLGHVFKTWKRRYFVLQDTKLSYYESESSGKAKGVVELRQYTIELPDINLLGGKSTSPDGTCGRLYGRDILRGMCCLLRHLHPSKEKERKPFILLADSEEDMHLWMRAFLAELYGERQRLHSVPPKVRISRENSIIHRASVMIETGITLPDLEELTSEEEDASSPSGDSEDQDDDRETSPSESPKQEGRTMKEPGDSGGAFGRLNRIRRDTGKLIFKKKDRKKAKMLHADFSEKMEEDDAEEEEGVQQLVEDSADSERRRSSTVDVIDNRVRFNECPEPVPVERADSNRDRVRIALLKPQAVDERAGLGDESQTPKENVSEEKEEAFVKAARKRRQSEAAALQRMQERRERAARSRNKTSNSTPSSTVKLTNNSTMNIALRAVSNSQWKVASAKLNQSLNLKSPSASNITFARETSLSQSDGGSAIAGRVRAQSVATDRDRRRSRSPHRRGFTKAAWQSPAMLQTGPSESRSFAEGLGARGLSPGGGDSAIRSQRMIRRARSRSFDINISSDGNTISLNDGGSEEPQTAAHSFSGAHMCQPRSPWDGKEREMQRRQSDGDEAPEVEYDEECYEEYSVDGDLYEYEEPEEEPEEVTVLMHALSSIRDEFRSLSKSQILQGDGDSLYRELRGLVVSLKAVRNAYPDHMAEVVTLYNTLQREIPKRVEAAYEMRKKQLEQAANTKEQAELSMKGNGRGLGDQSESAVLAAPCSVCAEPLSGPNVEAMGNFYHQRCFKCALCASSFLHGQYVNIENKPYCDDCGRAVWMRQRRSARMSCFMERAQQVQTPKRAQPGGSPLS